MKHLGHQNREKDVYDGDMVVYSGTIGYFWGVKGAKREAKEGQATNLQAHGGRREVARRPQGWCEGSFLSYEGGFGGLEGCFGITLSSL